MKQIGIAGRRIGEGQPCFIIGEAGVNHNGDVDLARKLVDAAADAGVDAIKFQTYNSDQLVAPDAAKADYQVDTTGAGETQGEMLRKLELPRRVSRRSRPLVLTGMSLSYRPPSITIAWTCWTAWVCRPSRSARAN